MSHTSAQQKDSSLCSMKSPLYVPTFVVEMGNKAMVLSVFGALDGKIHPRWIVCSAIVDDQIGKGLSYKIACFFIHPINA